MACTVRSQAFVLIILLVQQSLCIGATKTSVANVRRRRCRGVGIRRGASWGRRPRCAGVVTTHYATSSRAAEHDEKGMHPPAKKHTRRNGGSERKLRSQVKTEEMVGGAAEQIDKKVNPPAPTPNGIVYWPTYKGWYKDWSSTDNEKLKRYYKIMFEMSSKLKVIKKLLDKHLGKVMVFVPDVNVLNYVRTFLVAWYGQDNMIYSICGSSGSSKIWQIHGDVAMSPEEQEHELDAFEQTSAHAICLLSPCASVARNYSFVDLLIVMEEQQPFLLMEQLISRPWRANKDGKVATPTRVIILHGVLSQYEINHMSGKQKMEKQGSTLMDVRREIGEDVEFVLVLERSKHE